jgi:chromosome segregation ATPase
LISVFSKHIKSIQSEKLKSAIEELDSQDTGKSLFKFLKALLEEHKSITEVMNSYKTDEEFTARKFSELEHKYKSLLIENGSLTERENHIKSELDALLDHKHKIEAERNEHYRRCLELESENQQLNVERSKAYSDIERLESRVKQMSIIKERHALDYRHKTLLTYNEVKSTTKDQLEYLTNERNDLESMLLKISGVLPAGELRKNISELIKTQLYIHGIGRERCQLVATLNQTEGLLRSNTTRTECVAAGIQLRKEVEKLREELLNYEEQIVNGKERLMKLEEELERIGASENRKATVFLDNEKLLKQGRDRIEELEQQAANMRYELKSAEEYRPHTERYKSNNENMQMNYNINERATLKERLMKVKSSFTSH